MGWEGRCFRIQMSIEVSIFYLVSCCSLLFFAGMNLIAYHEIFRNAWPRYETWTFYRKCRDSGIYSLYLGMIQGALVWFSMFFIMLFPLKLLNGVVRIKGDL